MADRSVSVPMTLSDLKGGTRGVQFFKRISLITFVPFDQNDQIRQDNTRGGVQRGSATPIHNRAGPQRSPIFVFLFIHVYTICHRNTKFDMVIHMGRGLVFSIYVKTFQKKNKKR